MSNIRLYAAALSGLLVCSQAVLAQVGLDELIARIGEENIPTGLNIIVSQVEAPSGGYGPDQSNPQFDDKDFFAMSGEPGNSGHATTVALHMYGNTSSIAPDIMNIYLYDANHWLLSGFLRVSQGSGNPPLIPPADLKVFNHSWVGGAPNDSLNNEVLRRADFVMQRDNLLMVVGVNNGGASFPLMSHIYNGLAVGLTSGGHTSDATMPGIDGPGRLKPEIVAPSGQTSFSAPIVSAAVALMNEIAVTDVAVASNPNAQASEVIKAILLGGGNHRDGWTNNPETSGPDRGFTDQPLDDIFGVDEVNIDTSHLIMTGGEQDGANTPPESINITHAAWDLATVGLDSSMYWRFNTTELADEVSILAYWHREVRHSFTTFWLADFELTLWTVDGTGELMSLLGDMGVDYFTTGNVVSDSAVDNIEHLYIRGLAPGDYVLEVRRLDNLTLFRQWDVAVTWVIDADEKPLSIICPADAEAECSEDVPAADIHSVRASGVCGGATITHQGDVSDGMACPETITRTYRATDLCSNLVECTQTITVDDVTDPILDSCPEDITIDSAPASCEAVVNYEDPAATDNCDSSPSVVCDPPSGSTFPAGTTPVTCTATDDCDNSGQCAFNVIISILADLDNDGGVGPTDLALLLGDWGPCVGCAADFNGDGVVGAFDLAILLGSWGPCE